MKKIISPRISRLWLPVVCVIIASATFASNWIFGFFRRYSELFIIIVGILFIIFYLGICFSAIWNMAKKRWRKGIIQFGVFISIPAVPVVVMVIDKQLHDYYPKCNEGGYAEYIPVVSEREPGLYDHVSIDATIATPEHYENVKFVLGHERVPYQVVDDKILLECKVWKDKNGMVNITYKANDDNWLRRNKFDLRTETTDNGIELRVIDSVTKRVKKRIGVPFEGTALFSHDADRIIYHEYPSNETTGQNRIIVFDVGTGTQIGKAMVSKDAGFFDVSSDDKQLIYSTSFDVNMRMDLEP